MTTQELSVLAAALANDARVKVLQLLLQSGSAGLVVGDIQRELGVPGPSLSHHLERLRRAGFVTVRRQGTFLWYLPVAERVRQLGEILLQLAGGAAANPSQEATVRPEAVIEVEIEAD